MILLLVNNMSVDVTFFKDITYLSSESSDHTSNIFTISLPIPIIPITSLVPSTPVASSVPIVPRAPLQVYSSHQPLVSSAPPPWTSNRNSKGTFIVIQKVSIPAHNILSPTMIMSPTWCRAIDEEMSALTSRGTWELMDSPTGADVVAYRLVFTVKYQLDVTIDKL